MPAPSQTAAPSPARSEFSRACFQITPYEGWVRLPERLSQLVPAREPNKTIFSTTGAKADAVTTAKILSGGFLLSAGLELIDDGLDIMESRFHRLLGGR